MNWRLWILASGLTALPLSADAETIHLKNGKSIEGKVLSREANRIWLDTEAGRVPLPVARIAEAKPETWSEAQEAFAQGQNKRALRLAQIVIFWEPEHEDALQLIRRAENQIVMAERGRELSEIEQLARETLERFEARLADVDSAEADPATRERELLRLESTIRTAAQNFEGTAQHAAFLDLTEEAAERAVEAHREELERQEREARRRELDARRLRAEAMGLRDFHAAVATLNNGGKPLDLEDLNVPGGIMVFSFYADWSAEAGALDPGLRKLAEREEGVFLRRINILGWDTPLARQYDLRSLPAVWIYNGQGELMASGLKDLEGIVNAVEESGAS